MGTNYPGIHNQRSHHHHHHHSFHFTLFNAELSDWKWQTSPGRNIWYTRIKATVKKATNDDENDGNNDDNDGVPFARRSSQSPAKYRLSTIVG